MAGFHSNHIKPLLSCHLCNAVAHQPQTHNANLHSSGVAGAVCMRGDSRQGTECHRPLETHTLEIPATSVLIARAQCRLVASMALEMAAMVLSAEIAYGTRRSKLLWSKGLR